MFTYVMVGAVCAALAFFFTMLHYRSVLEAKDDALKLADRLVSSTDTHIGYVHKILFAQVQSLQHDVVTAKQETEKKVLDFRNKIAAEYQKFKDGAKHQLDDLLK